MNTSTSTGPANAAAPGHLLLTTSLSRGILIGLIAALILMPVHVALVSASYDNGYYNPWIESIVFTAIAVIFATRFGSGIRGNFKVAVATVGLTLFHLATSEYLVSRYLMNQVLIEQGYDRLPLVVGPVTAVSLLGAYFENDSAQVFLWGLMSIMALMIGWVSPKTATFRPPDAIKVAEKVRGDDIPAEAYSLGQPVEAYYTRTTELLVKGGLLCLVGVGPMIAMVTTHASLGVWALTGWFIAFALVLGGYRLVLAWRNMDNQVLVFNDGLSIRQNGSIVVLRWNEISTVWRDQYRFSVNYIPIIDRHKYTLDTRSSGKIVLDKTYKEIGDLGAAVQNGVARILFKPAVEALQKGETLRFGNLALRRDSLIFGERHYPWPISIVSVMEGNIYVAEKSQPRKSKPVAGISSIPNLHLFLGLVELLSNGNLPPAAPSGTVSQGG